MSVNLNAKVAVGKLLEVAYSTNEGVTTNIVRSGSNFKISVDATGSGKLSGTFGVLNFDGRNALESLGLAVRRVSITFTNQDGQNIGYSATISPVSGVSLIVTGRFNLEELLMSCSGLLCKAARAMKGRSEAYEQELKRIMGQ